MGNAQAAPLSKKRKRLAVVISHPIQHFAPLFAALANEPSIDLKVFYCCDWGIKNYADPGFGKTFKWDIPLLQGYDHEFLPISRRPKDLGFRSVDNPEVSVHLDSFNPDAVWIHGYSQKTSWRAYFWAVRKGRAILYFGDSELLAPRSLVSRGFKRVILPAFFSRCHAFLTIGDNNENYYRYYCVPERKFYRGSFPVDIKRFQAVASSIGADDRREERKAMGLMPNALVALFVGKFIDIKRPLDIVKAVHRLRNEIPNLQALMFGSGPLEEDIRNDIQRLDLEKRVFLPGFVNQADMPRALVLGDFLVMSSEVDPHPLAVTEAMSVGNAVIASDRVGCVGPTDAARAGENTLVYPHGDIDKLCRSIKVLCDKPEKLEKFRERSLQLSMSQDISVMVSAINQALNTIAA